MYDKYNKSYFTCQVYFGILYKLFNTMEKSKKVKAGGLIAALVVGAAIGSVAMYVISQKKAKNEKQEKQ